MIDARSDRFDIGMHRNKPLRVIVCLITLVAFFVSTFSCDLARAVDFDKTGDSNPKKILNVKTFTIPEDMGHIKEACIGSGTKTIIQIQDAHCNYAAQKRVAEIIEYLNTEYGITAVNLEGGAEDYDLSIFTDIADRSVREKTADYFVKEGLVSGAEYFAINNPEKVSLWGVEDPALYMENLSVYRNSLAHKDEIDKSLKSLSYVLTNLKIKIYSKELLEFDTKYSQYKANNIEFKDYLGYIFTAAKERAVDINAFRNISLLNKSLQEEASVDFRKANNERDSLVDMLHKRLSRNSMEELVVKTVEFKTEKISHKDFYAYLLDKAKKAGLDLSGLSELKKYVAYIAAYDAIDKMKVMDELDGLETKIKDAMIENNTQRDLSALSKNLTLMKNMFDISLTRDDYRYYKANEDAFAIRNYTRFIDDSAPKYKIAARPDENIGNIDRYRDEISGFYDCSFKRDTAFVKNIKFREPPATIRGRANETAIIVTGGFHTDNLCEIFRKEGISYISIVPVFKNDEGYQSPYFNILAGKMGGLVGQMRAVLSSASVMQVSSPFSKAIAEKVFDKMDIDSVEAAVALESMAIEKGWEIDRIEPWGDSVVVHLQDGTFKEITLKELVTGRPLSTFKRDYTKRPGDDGFNPMPTHELLTLEGLYPGLLDKLNKWKEEKLRTEDKKADEKPLEVLFIGPGDGREILGILDDPKYADLNLKFSSIGLESFFKYSDRKQSIEEIRKKYYADDVDGDAKARKAFEMLRDNFRHVDMDKGLTYRDAANIDKDKTFDIVIFGRNVMRYSKDRIALIEEIYRILEPGGIGIVDLQPIVIGDNAVDVEGKMQNRNEKQEQADVMRHFKEFGVPGEFEVEYSRNYPTLTIRKSANGSTIKIPLLLVGDKPADGTVARFDFLQGYVRVPEPPYLNHLGMLSRGAEELKDLYPDLDEKLSGLSGLLEGAEVLFMGPGYGYAILDILRDYPHLKLKFSSLGRESFFKEKHRKKLIPIIQWRYHRVDRKDDETDAEYEKRVDEAKEGAIEAFEMLRDGFIEADMNNIDDLKEKLKDRKFDAVIFGNHVMDYCEDRIALIEEVYRILKPSKPNTPRSSMALIDLQPIIIGGPGDAAAEVAQKMSNYKMDSRNPEEARVAEYFEQLNGRSEFKVEYSKDGNPILIINKSGDGNTVNIPLSRVGEDKSDKISDPLHGYTINPAPSPSADEQPIWYRYEPDSGLGKQASFLIRHPTQLIALRDYVANKVKGGARNIVVASLGSGSGQEPCSLAAYLLWLQDTNNTGKSKEDMAVGELLKDVTFKIVAVENNKDQYEAMQNILISGKNFSVTTEYDEAVDMVNRYLEDIRDQKLIEIVNKPLEDYVMEKEFQGVNIVVNNNVLNAASINVIEKFWETVNARDNKPLILTDHDDLNASMEVIGQEVIKSKTYEGWTLKKLGDYAYAFVPAKMSASITVFEGQITVTPCDRYGNITGPAEILSGGESLTIGETAESKMVIINAPPRIDDTYPPAEYTVTINVKEGAVKIALYGEDEKIKRILYSGNGNVQIVGKVGQKAVVETITNEEYIQALAAKAIGPSGDVSPPAVSAVASGSESSTGWDSEGYFDTLRRLGAYDYGNKDKKDTDEKNKMKLEITEKYLSQIGNWFGTNESDGDASLGDMEGRTGAYIGVAYGGQNFSRLCHGNFSKAIIIDSNPFVTEIFMPIRAALITQAGSRAEYLGFLAGVQLDDKELERLKREGIDFKDAPLGDIAEYILARAKDTDDAVVDFRKDTWERIRGQFPDNLKGPADSFWKEYALKKPGSKESSKKFGFKEMIRGMGSKGSWLANEKNFETIQNMTRKGNIIGITGDWTDESKMTAVAEYMKEAELRASVIYNSNISEWLDRIADPIKTNKARMNNINNILPRTDDSILLEANVSGKTMIIRGREGKGSIVATDPKNKYATAVSALKDVVPPAVSDAASYIADVIKTAKPVLGGLSPDGKKFVLVPISEKLCPSNSTSLHSKLQKTWKAVRNELESKDKYDIGGVTLVFYDGALESADKKLSALAADGANQANTVVYIDAMTNKDIDNIKSEIEKAAEEKRPVEGSTAMLYQNIMKRAYTVKDTADPQGGYLSITGHVVFALGALELINATESASDPMYFAQVMALMQKISPSAENYSANKDKFLNDFKRGEITLRLPPISKIDIDGNMETYFATEIATVTSL